MNLAALLAAGTALCLSVARDRGAPLGLLAACAFALSLGIYPFVFAPQLEVLLCAAYAGIAVLLRRDGALWASRNRGSVALWALIGMVGWLKSPLHSALCGLGVGLTWLFAGELRQRLANARTWAAVTFGILVGLAGFLPAALADWEAFHATYIVRETWRKGPNGVSVANAILPILTYLQWPLTPLLLAQAIRTPRKVSVMRQGRVPVELGLILPTLVFFAIHPYRSETYALPLIGPLVALLARGVPGTKRFAAWCDRCGGTLIGLVVAIPLLPAVVFASGRLKGFDTLTTSTLAAGIGAGLFALGALAWRGPAAPRALATVVAAYLALGFWLRDAGRHDLVDLRHAAATLEQGEPLTVWNAEQRTWSEWGAMNGWLQRPVVGLHDGAAVDAALRAGSAVIAPHATARDDVESRAKTLGIAITTESLRRWRIGGRNSEGQAAALWQSLSAGNWAMLERPIYAVRPTRPGH